MRLPAAAPILAVAAVLTALPADAQAPWSAEGRLEDSDSADADGHRYDDHVVRLEAGRRYRISAASEDFDTYLRLYRGSDTEPAAENDDFEGLNSRIVFQPPATGEYRLRVLAYAPDGRGAYSAGVETMPPLPAPVAAPDRTVNSSGSWALWQRSLAATDPDRDGRHFDDFLIAMQAGETRWIAAHSDAFDIMVAILPASDPEGDPIDSDDDSGPGFNSLLGFRAETAGDYIVRVTSYSAGETGAYTLWVSR